MNNRKKTSSARHIDPPTLSERLVVAFESIAESLRKMNEPVISGGPNMGIIIDMQPSKCPNCKNGCTFINDSACRCKCHNK